jgi:hypothetical protein
VKTLESALLCTARGALVGERAGLSGFQKRVLLLKTLFAAGKIIFEAYAA